MYVYRLPWKTEKVEEIYPDAKYFTQPLPHAPGSYQWSQSEDKSWILQRQQLHDDSATSSTAISEEIISETPIIVEHLLLPNDTIQGICLKYRVKAMELRRLNMFSGDNLKSFKTLKIPLSPGIPYSIAFETKDNILQRFLAMTNEGAAEASLYLEDNNWVLEKALSAWKSDESWQKTSDSANAESNTSSSSSSYQNQRKAPPLVSEISTDIDYNANKSKGEFDINSMDNMHRMMVSASIPGEEDEGDGIARPLISARRFIDTFIKPK